MTEKKDLLSLSGAPIWRHKERTKPFDFAVGEEENIEEISSHIERHVGPVNTVWHELISDLVHIDVHHVEPSEERNFHVLVTSGMSDKPMSTPQGVEDRQYAELLVSLPDDWPVTQESFKNETNYWPVRMLKQLARLPHEYDTWLWWSHTVDNGNPAEAFDSSTKQMCAILAPPILLPEDFWELETQSGRVVSFFSVIPIYREELKFKMNKGADALFDRFDKYGVTELIDPRRVNTCTSWWRRFVNA